MVALYDCLETMVVLPENGFYLQGLDNEIKNTHVIPNGICVAAGGENGCYISLPYKLCHVNY